MKIHNSILELCDKVLGTVNKPNDLSLAIFLLNLEFFPDSYFLEENKIWPQTWMKFYTDIKKRERCSHTER